MFCLVASLFAEPLAQNSARDILVCFTTSLPPNDKADLPFASDIVSLNHVLRRQAATVSMITAATVVKARAICRALQNRSDVAWAELRPLRQVDARSGSRPVSSPLDGPPNDPFYSLQWYLDRIEAPTAWDIVAPNGEVVIAVLDDGVHFGHPDLAAARWQNDAEVNGIANIDDDLNGYVDDLYGYDFIDQDGDPTPDPVGGENSHGTHVAGIAAAARNNFLGIAGVAGGAKIMAVRVGQNGSIPYGFEGFLYAIRNGARIINCSWGGSTESSAESQIVAAALEAGCIVIVSAGNNGNNTRRYPAAIEGVVSVAATNATDQRADFSNFGSWVKLSAPGVWMQSCLYDANGHTYGAWQGTSMAAPVVAGISALIKQKNPDLTGPGIAAILCNSADPIDAVNPGFERQLGCGRVNAYRAAAETPFSFHVTNVCATEEPPSDGDGRIEAGETGSLTCRYENLLGELTQVSVHVQSENPPIQILDPVVHLSYPIAPNSFGELSALSRFHLADDVPRGALFPMVIEFRDGAGILRSRDTWNVILDSTFAVLDNGLLGFGLGEQGALGYVDYIRNVPLGPGFTLAGDRASGLYHGSVFVSANGKVIDNFYGNAEGTRFDFAALPGTYSGHVIAQQSDLAVSARFDDRLLSEAERLNVEVCALALAWPDVSGIALELTVINRGPVDWNPGVCGLIMDWDLAGPSRNIGFYDGSKGVLVAQSELNGFPLVGIAGLGADLMTAYEISNRDELSGGGIPESRMLELVNAGMGGFNNSPRDLSHIAALPLPALSPGDSAQLGFVVITAPSMTELQATLDSIVVRYDSSLLQHETDAGNSTVLLRVGPNPLRTGDDLAVSGLPDGEMTLKLYNILGQTVGTFTRSAGVDGTVTLTDLPALPPGLLVYRLEHSGGASAGKLLYIP
ncbi:MAG: S8 family serine peptidase [bacterium]|nr:S8 family serine peptidase [bacterium]